MYFQAFDYKGKQFLDLNGNNQTIAPTYTKEEAWLKYVGQSNTLTTRCYEHWVGLQLLSAMVW